MDGFDDVNEHRTQQCATEEETPDRLVTLASELPAAHRREALRRIGQATAVAVLTGCAGVYFSGRETRLESRGDLPGRRDFRMVPDSELAQVAGEDPAAMVESLIEGLGGIDTFVRPGEIVGI